MWRQRGLNITMWCLLQNVNPMRKSQKKFPMPLRDNIFWWWWSPLLNFKSKKALKHNYLDFDVAPGFQLKVAKLVKSLFCIIADMNFQSCKKSTFLRKQRHKKRVRQFYVLQWIPCDLRCSRCHQKDSILASWLQRLQHSMDLQRMIHVWLVLKVSKKLWGHLSRECY